MWLYITQTRQTGLFIYEVSKYFTCFTGSVGRHSKFGKMYLKTLEALVIIRICSGIMFFSLSNSSLIMCSEAILPLFNSNYGKLLIVISCMVCPGGDSSRDWTPLSLFSISHYTNNALGYNSPVNCKQLRHFCRAW